MPTIPSKLQKEFASITRKPGAGAPGLRRIDIEILKQAISEIYAEPAVAQKISALVVQKSKLLVANATKG